MEREIIFACRKSGLAVVPIKCGMYIFGQKCYNSNVMVALH